MPVLEKKVREIARDYFADILYIDDALKSPDRFLQPLMEEAAAGAAEVNKNEVYSGGRPLMSKHMVNILDIEQHHHQSAILDSRNDFIIAYQLINQFQKLGCKASPFYFESKDDLELAFKLIEKTHLTILDWHLDDSNGETTLRLLARAVNNIGRMKIITIFTNMPGDAIRQLTEVYSGINVNSTRRINGQPYDYVHINDSLILIFDKNNYTAENIVESVIDRIINDFGYFPLAFFDSINKINDKTANILKRFSKPFETSLMLQLQSSGFAMSDFPKVVSGMVTNHINKVVDVDIDIFSLILEHWQTQIDLLLAMTEAALLEKIITYICELSGKQNSSTNGKVNRKYMELLKEVSFSKWQEYLQNCKTACGNSISGSGERIGTSDEIINEVAMIKAIRIYESDRTLENSGRGNLAIKNKFIELLTQKVKPEVVSILGPLLPAFFIYIIARLQKNEFEVTSIASELVQMMKIIPYDKTEMTDLNELATKGDEAYNNYFSSGDIIFKLDSSQVLLCISPSCDVFRPKKKVENCLKFLVGTVIDKDSEIKMLKEGQRLTIIPNPNNMERLLCVKWEFYKTQVLSIHELVNLQRPFRLESTYCQQIINQYIAYQSRAGVDELFFKENTSLRNFFIFTAG